jgi:hypothetical protein
MSGDRHADQLMDKLLRAIELSLRATLASREALQEILKRGAETGIFFAGTRTAAPPAAGSGGYELTEQDRDFLRSLSIQPDIRG